MQKEARKEGRKQKIRHCMEKYYMRCVRANRKTERTAQCQSSGATKLIISSKGKMRQKEEEIKQEI